MINKKLLLSLIIISVSFSFSLKKEKHFLPPGTAKINETFFADETEVSNFSWNEYESWTKAKYGTGSKEHLAVLPDTLVWRKDISDNEPYVFYYYRHPAYKDHPVVGISYDQVIAFCKWRTDRVKEFYYNKTKKELNIEYRLPSKEEWEMISNNGAGILDNDGYNKKGMMQLNITRFPKDSIYTKDIMNKDGDVTAPVYSYWKNNLGLFNTFGNVAEMINKKGLSKGGSWVNQLEDCRADKQISYTEPTAWLGFRCVCVINK